MRFGPDDTATPFLQGFVNARARYLDCWQKREQQRANDSREQSKTDDCCINLCLIQSWNVTRAKRAEQIDPPPGEKQSCHSSDQRQNKSFANKLPNNSGTACAESGANRNLAAALGGASKQRSEEHTSEIQSHS